MQKGNHATKRPALPVASPDETVDAMVAESKRDHTPVRIAFLQKDVAAAKQPGPLAEFVTNGDRAGLLLFLLVLTKASTPPWDTALSAAVWARALGHDLPTSKAAASGISKTWLRLEKRHLIERGRTKRKAHITLLREDGSGSPYSHPGDEGGYFKLPAAFWCEGPSPTDRWFRTLTLPETAMLLIASSLKARFALAFEKVPDWYGISADSAARGLHGLAARGILTIDNTFKKAPLAPQGYTAENRYTLAPPFQHRDVSRTAVS